MSKSEGAIVSTNKNIKEQSFVLMIWRLLAAFLCISLSSIVHAAPANDQLIQRQSEIVREQQQKRDDERKNFQEQRSRTPPARPVTLDLLQGDGNLCVEIKRIIFEGAKTVSDNELNVVIQSFKGRCLTIVDIQNVLRVVTNYYIEKGFVTSRAYLVPQDLNQGTLKVLAVEGNVEEIRILKNGKERSGGNQIFGRRKENILNIRDFEQGMDQINRLSSKDAKIRIEPGDKVGGSVVYIDVEHTHDISITTTLDNNGSKNTGRTQAFGSVTSEDFFGLYESISLTSKTSLDELHRGIYSRSYNSFITVPLHYTTFNFSGSYSEYRSELLTSAQIFSLEGNSYEARMDADHVVYRDQKYIVRIGGGLTFKENKNYIEDLFIDASSQRLTIAELSANLSGPVLGGFGQAGATFKQGLNIFGAQSDGDNLSGAPSAQFTELEFTASLQKQWRLKQGVLGLVGSGFFALSPDTLYSSERTSVGGISSIRGYRDDSLLGDNGGYARLELTWLPEVPESHSDLSKFVGRPQFYAGLDAGGIFEDANDQFEGGSLSSGTVGIRLFGGPVSADVSFSQPFHQHGLISKSDTKGFFRYSVSANWKF